jgi:hypothetical protein
MVFVIRSTEWYNITYMNILDGLMWLHINKH